jgi:hypothetical protein
VPNVPKGGSRHEQEARRACVKCPASLACVGNEPRFGFQCDDCRQYFVRLHSLDNKSAYEFHVKTCPVIIFIKAGYKCKKCQKKREMQSA